LTEELPYKANGPRGSTRAKMAKELQAAHNSGNIRIASGRASDFFGPRVHDSAAGEQIFRAALNGKKAQIMVSDANLHTFDYVPDMLKV
jgi:nucleoside-diphosphate-sugar epimerase